MASPRCSLRVVIGPLVVSPLDVAFFLDLGPFLPDLSRCDAFFLSRRLAHPNLFTDDGPLPHLDLFLADRDRDLTPLESRFTGPRLAAAGWYAFDVDLFARDRHRDVLALGFDFLSQMHTAGFFRSLFGAEFFFHQRNAHLFLGAWSRRGAGAAQLGGAALQVDFTIAHIGDVFVASHVIGPEENSLLDDEALLVTPNDTAELLAISSSNEQTLLDVTPHEFLLRPKLRTRAAATKRPALVGT
ncbi:MAG TPA: hypothetical protein VE620_12420 [Myxococcales bacterium]|nr:hypothetical protein [Myxococcales bacterium]